MVDIHKLCLENPRGNLFIPSKLGDVRVIYKGREFFVVNLNGAESFIQKANLSCELRGISPETLQKILNFGYLSLNKQESDYTLRFDGKIYGGGPVCGFIGYWGTKAICYGGAIAAATTVVVGTGGAIAGPVGTAIASGAASTVATTTGTGIVAAAVGSSPVAVGIATELTMATVSTAGGVGGAIAAVESASSLIGTSLLLCPFLP